MIGLVLGVAAVVEAPLLMRRVERRSSEMDEGEWWKRVLPWAVLVWFVGDVSATISAILYMLAGQAVLLLVTALGLGILIFASPGRLRDR